MSAKPIIFLVLILAGIGGYAEADLNISSTFVFPTIRVPKIHSKIRFKTLSFGTDFTPAFEVFYGKPPDSIAVERQITSLIASSHCKRRHYKSVRECVAQQVHYFRKTSYQCCLLQTVGFQIDYLRRMEADKVWMYGQLPKWRETAKCRSVFSFEG